MKIYTVMSGDGLLVEKLKFVHHNEKTSIEKAIQLSKDDILCTYRIDVWENGVKGYHSKYFFKGNAIKL